MKPCLRSWRYRKSQYLQAQFPFSRTIYSKLGPNGTASTSFVVKSNCIGRCADQERTAFAIVDNLRIAATSGGNMSKSIKV